MHIWERPTRWWKRWNALALLFAHLPHCNVETLTCMTECHSKRQQMFQPQFLQIQRTSTSFPFHVWQSIQNKPLRTCKSVVLLITKFGKEKWEFLLVTCLPSSSLCRPLGSVQKIITAMSICRMPPKPKMASLGRSQDALTKICLMGTFSSDLQTR